MEQKKSLRSFTIQFKLAALDFLKTHSVQQTANEFKVDPKRIREWRTAKPRLEAQYETGNKNRKRFSGAGKKIRSPELEDKLVEWIVRSRENRLRVSRSMIKRKALEWFAVEGGNEFKASNGWLQKFLSRHGFVLRRRTTVSQKVPRDSMEKIVAFILYLREVRRSGNYENNFIFVMDETPVWVEPIATTTINKIGSREVAIKSTGHEKMRITVVLTARADGAKCKPFIVIPRKRPIKEVEEIKEVECAYSAKSWMDDELTSDYLKRIIGSFSFTKRLLIWDAFRCHISERTKTQLRAMRIDSVVIPAGCTGKIQAPDVSWNRSFKCNFSKSYEEWMANGDHTFTPSGNLRPPSFELITKWVKSAWNDIPKEQIIASMKQCGVTNATNGSEDNLIDFVKQNPEAADMLSKRFTDDQTAMEVETDCESNSSDCAVIDESEDDDIEYCDSDESN